MEPVIVYQPDEAGRTLKYREYQGSYYPYVFTLEALIQNTIDVRPDDVVLSCYPKSGTHWFWEIIHQLKAGKAENMRSKWKGDEMIESKTLSELKAVPSPRVLNTHLLFEQLPDVLVQKKCKIVHVIRNPRDAGVSYYFHHNLLKWLYEYDGEWKDYFSLYLKGKLDWGSWFDNTISYLKAKEQRPDVPLLIVYYEDMQKDPLSEIARIADFLGLSADHSLCQEISKQAKIDIMRQVATETQRGLIQDGIPCIFRKGIVGDWKNWFTVAQSEEFNRIFAEKMSGYSLPPQYTL